MVGVKGFEPSAPWSQTKCANQTALHPEYIKGNILSQNNFKVKDFHLLFLKTPESEVRNFWSIH